MTAPAVLNPRPSQMAEETFVDTYGDVYEHSPWIARKAWRRGLSETEDTPEGLARAMAAVVEEASEERQLALIRAHPDLAGKAAVRGDLTDDSTREQSGAGLDQCSPQEFERFQELNRLYWERFGFPFVLAVRGYDRHGILAAFEQRVSNPPDVERAAAVEQINRIALLRLQQRAVPEG